MSVFPNRLSNKVLTRGDRVVDEQPVLVLGRHDGDEELGELVDDLEGVLLAQDVPPVEQPAQGEVGPWVERSCL